jgi:hypothetical protein
MVTCVVCLADALRRVKHTLNASPIRTEAIVLRIGSSKYTICGDSTARCYALC